MSEVARKTGRMVPEFAPHRDQGLVELAIEQHGPLSLPQLIESGLSASAVRKRVAAGRLQRLHQGVYAYGHSVLRIEGIWMAAVLACEPDAYLSHPDACALWALQRPGGSRVHVTVRGRSGRRRPGITIHSARDVHPDDVTWHKGIPTTTVSRTLVDMAGLVDRPRLERLVDQAEILRLFDRAELDATLARAVGRRGTGALKQILADYDAPAPTKNELEEGMLAICKRAGIERPQVNETIVLAGEEFEVDFHWPRRHLIVETDGFETHGTRRSFEEDRRREQFALAAGWRLVRITWRQMRAEPARLALMLRTVRGE